MLYDFILNYVIYIRVAYVQNLRLFKITMSKVYESLNIGTCYFEDTFVISGIRKGLIDVMNILLTHPLLKIVGMIVAK